MKHVIIGTAGHVDHGKTALIKALTGTDTDRLKEEKARGISIDLGFASLRLSDGLAAGIVDVPGHERFLKNMLAGTGGIDMVMLVIAADEGVMPQTREHLAMLSLYGVRNGIVALNKVDKVDPEWLDLVEEDIRGLLKGTFLAEAPMCRVSAIAGTGLTELKETLLQVADAVPARDSNAPFRLWIDRVFTVKGHGAVVTGSSLSGSITVGDNLKVYPSGNLVRVRGIEWHGQKVDRIYAGQRTAINITGPEVEQVDRGMALSAPTRGEIAPAWDLDADWREEVASGTRVRLHLGTGEVLGRIYYYKDQPARYCRLILEEDLGASMGDRGIIRLYSPQNLLGGATLLAPAKKSRRQEEVRILLAKALAAHNLREVLIHLVDDGGQPAAPDEIKRRAGYVTDTTVESHLKELESSGEMAVVGGFYLTKKMLEGLEEAALKEIGTYHREQPDRAGLSKEILRQKLGLSERPSEVLLTHWQKKGILAVTGADVALKDFAGKHGDWRQSLLEKAELALADCGLGGVETSELATRLGLPADKARAALDILMKQGMLVRVGEFLLTRMTMQDIGQKLVAHFEKSPTINVGELRDLLNITRKLALPLIEYCDVQKYTVRDGDSRKAGPRLSDFRA